LVIVRPNAVYGPFDRETLQVFEMAGHFWHPVLNQPNARIAMIHGADAAKAIVALCAGDAPTGLFEISDACSQGYSWRHITETAARAVGREPRLVPVPVFALKLAGAVSGMVGRLQADPPIFNSGKVREMLHGDWSVKPERQVPAEIWSATINLKTGFADTVGWYRYEGWLKKP